MLSLSILSIIGESIVKNKGVSILLLVLSVLFIMIDSFALPKLTIAIVENIANIGTLKWLIVYSILCFIIRSLAQGLVDSKINIIYDDISNNLLSRLINRIHFNYETDISKLDTTVMATYYEKMNSSIIDLVSNMKYRKMAIIVITTVFLNYSFYNSLAFGALSTMVILTLIGLSAYMLNSSATINNETETRRNRFLGVFNDYISNIIPIYTHGTGESEVNQMLDRSETIHKESQKNLDMISLRRIATYVTTVVVILSLFYALVRYFPSIKNSSKRNIAILLFSLLVQFGHFSIYFIPTVEQMSKYGSIQNELDEGYLKKDDDRLIGGRDDDKLIGGRDDDDENSYMRKEKNTVYGNVYGNIKTMTSNVYTNVKTNVQHPFRVSAHSQESFVDGSYSIRVQDVYYRNILKGITLYIEDGEKVAIVGEIGSGKSTLLKCIGRFLPIHGGAIYVGGRDIHDPSYPLMEYRRIIGYVPQHISLFNRSIYDNIFYGMDLSEDQKLSYVDSLGIASIYGDLNRNVGVNGVNLSGGQRQLVYVLRNIIHPEKRILLLDEPTISLDPNIKEYMLNIIRNTKNKTVVVITHDSDCLKVVDRVISFDKA